MDPEGLLICLTCFHGGCAEHAALHFQKSGHPLALNIKKIVKPSIDEEHQGSPPKMAKLEIRTEKEPEYEEETSVLCLSCQDSIDLAAVKV